MNKVVVSSLGYVLSSKQQTVWYVLLLNDEIVDALRWARWIEYFAGLCAIADMIDWRYTIVEVSLAELVGNDESRRQVRWVDLLVGVRVQVVHLLVTTAQQALLH